MKTKFYSLFSILTLSFATMAQGVGINETGAAPDESAILDASSTTKGFLLPRMSEAERDAIVNPAEGLMVYCTDCGELQIYMGSTWLGLSAGPATPSPYPSGYVHCNSSNPTAIVDVTNGTTGKTWMDRNLGASRAAISSTDVEAYGSIFQWGRFADGHQCVNRYAGDGVTTSATTTTLSNSDTPGHGDFITIDNSPNDWRSPQNNNLWQGTGGTNNPCPIGYRLPTEPEFDQEILSWEQAPISSSISADGAFASPLKLPLAGFRYNNNGAPFDVGIAGLYWSSTVDNTDARKLFFDSTSAGMLTFSRAFGYSVRCIKD
jgi:uncharacterized protein (TIGR02145 family)